MSGFLMNLEPRIYLLLSRSPSGEEGQGEASEREDRPALHCPGLRTQNSEPHTCCDPSLSLEAGPRGCVQRLIQTNGETLSETPKFSPFTKLKSRCLFSHHHQLELNSPLQKCIVLGFLPIFIPKSLACGQVLSHLAQSSAISFSYVWEAMAGKAQLGLWK